MKDSNISDCRKQIVVTLLRQLATMWRSLVFTGADMQPGKVLPNWRKYVWRRCSLLKSLN